MRYGKLASRKGLKRSTVDACKSRKHEAVQDYAQEGRGGGSEAQRSTGESSDKCNGGEMCGKDEVS
jgi:hypothetical protein